MAGESLYFKSSPGDFNMQSSLSTHCLILQRNYKNEVTEFVKKKQHKKQTILFIIKSLEYHFYIYSYKLYTCSQQKLETA